MTNFLMYAGGVRSNVQRAAEVMPDRCFLDRRLGFAEMGAVRCAVLGSGFGWLRFVAVQILWGMTVLCPAWLCLCRFG